MIWAGDQDPGQLLTIQPSRAQMIWHGGSPPTMPSAATLRRDNISAHLSGTADGAEKVETCMIEGRLPYPPEEKSVYVLTIYQLGNKESYTTSQSNKPRTKRNTPQGRRGRFQLGVRPPPSPHRSISDDLRQYLNLQID